MQTSIFVDFWVLRGWVGGAQTRMSTLPEIPASEEMTRPRGSAALETRREQDQLPGEDIPQHGRSSHEGVRQYVQIRKPTEAGSLQNMDPSHRWNDECEVYSQYFKELILVCPHCHSPLLPAEGNKKGGFLLGHSREGGNLDTYIMIVIYIE